MGFRKNTSLAMAGKGATDRQFVRALARGFDVLKAFEADDRASATPNWRQEQAFLSQQYPA